MVAREMVERGVAVRQVARQLGVTEGALRYRLRQPAVPVDGRCDRASSALPPLPALSAFRPLWPPSAPILGGKALPRAA
jgi:hypothetical protein